MVWNFIKAFKEKKITDQPNRLYRFIYQEHKRNIACTEVLDGVKFDDDDEELFSHAKKPKIDEFKATTDELPTSSEILCCSVASEASNVSVTLNATMRKSEEPEEVQDKTTEELKVVESELLREQSELVEQPLYETLNDPAKVQKTKITDFFDRI